MRESLFPVLGVRSNSTIQVLHRFSRAGWLRRGKEEAAVDGGFLHVKDDRVDVLAEHAEMGGDVEQFRERRKEREEEEQQQGEE